MPCRYKEQYYFWELVELMRKLTLTGFVFLIPQQFSLLRLVLAILISVAHSVMLQAAQPHKQPSTAVVAVATSLSLQCTLFVALLTIMYAELPEDQIASFFGFKTAMPLAGVLFSAPGHPPLSPFGSW